MAKQKKAAPAPSKHVSIFWKGENSGDTIKGKFAAWQTTTLGNLAMKLDTVNGEKLVGMTTVLFNLFKENHNIKEGTPVEIVFEHRVKRAKIYSATVGGKKLSSSMSFPAASKDEVDAIFAAGYEFKGKGKGKGKK